jgi:hypothetical protein
MMIVTMGHLNSQTHLPSTTGGEMKQPIMNLPTHDVNISNVKPQKIKDYAAQNMCRFLTSMDR